MFLHGDRSNFWVPQFYLHFGFCLPSIRISVLFVSSLLASSKTKKTRGAANAKTQVKGMRRAGNNKKAPVNHIQSDPNKDEAVSQKLDALMAALSSKMKVLFGHADATKEREKVDEMPPVNHCHTCTARRRASPMGSPDPDPDQEVAEEIRERVAKRMRQLPALPCTPGDEDSSTDDADEPAPRCRR